MSNFTELTANGASASLRATGTLYQVEGEGTFGSGTLTPQKKSYDGTWITLGNITLNESGAINVEVPSGAEIRAELTAATAPSIKVHISKIR